MKIFDHIQHHSLAYFLHRPQAELLQLLRNDVAVLELNLGQIVGQATVATLQTLAAFLVILLWEPRLALLCVIGLGAGAALIWLASRLTNRALPREIAAAGNRVPFGRRLRCRRPSPPSIPGNVRRLS